MSPTIGPYSPVRFAGDWVVSAGQIGVVADESGNTSLVPGGTEAELRQAFANLSEALVSESVTSQDLVKVTVYLVDMADFAVVNTVWTDIFSTGYLPPARTTVQVAGLPLGARVEIEGWAHKASGPANQRSSQVYL